MSVLGIHLYHLVSDPLLPRRFAFGIAVPLLLAVVVLVGGGYLWERDHPSGSVLRAGGWCLTGAAAFALGGGLVVLYERTYGVYLVDTLFVIANSASGGAAIGLLVGIYEARRRAARRRADRRSQQLTVLNRVLRHDIRTTATLIQGATETIGDAETAARIQEQTATLVELGDRARRIEGLVHDDGAEPGRIDLVPVIETCCTQLEQSHPSAEITTALPKTLPVRASPLIESAILDILPALKGCLLPTPRVAIEISESD